MKIPLIIFGSLLVAFGECSPLALNWNPLEWLQQSEGSHSSSHSGPGWSWHSSSDKSKLESHSSSHFGFNFGADEWENIRQQCAEKGFSPIKRSGGNGKISIDQNGVKHYYEQTVDPNTGEIQGRYYSYNSHTNEPFCGKLTCPHCT